MRVGASGLLAGMVAVLLGAAPVESTPGELSGAVKQVGPEAVRIAVPGAPDVRLHMKPRTIVVVNGQMATLGDIQEGDRIRALYRDVQGYPMAIMVEVTGPARPAPEE